MRRSPAARRCARSRTPRADLTGDPSLGQRLRYALGGRLPEEHADWVRHDLTDAGWRARALGRTLVQALPVAALLALLPGPWYVHVMLPAFLLLCALFVSAAYGDDLRDRRLRQHGLPVPPREGPPQGF